MRSLILLLVLLVAAEVLVAAPPVQKKGGTGEERIVKENLLGSDKLIRYGPNKVCGLDRYKYFCCPIRKIVRRQAAGGKWTDYCYNGRDELIGIRKSDHRGTVKRSDFSALSGCTQCGSDRIKQHSWKHNTKPRVIIPKRKR